MRTDNDKPPEPDPDLCAKCLAPLEIVDVKFRLLGPAHSVYSCPECGPAFAEPAKAERKSSPRRVKSLSFGVDKLQLRLRKIPVKPSR